MKAIVQDKFGEADVLEFREVPDPVIGDDEVLIQVRAAGAGPDVWHVMAGKAYIARPVPEFRRVGKGPRGRGGAGGAGEGGVTAAEVTPGGGGGGGVAGARRGEA